MKIAWEIRLAGQFGSVLLSDASPPPQAVAVRWDRLACARAVAVRPGSELRGSEAASESGSGQVRRGHGRSLVELRMNASSELTLYERGE